MDQRARGRRRRPLPAAIPLAAAILLVAPSLALAHARISPALSLSKQLQLYSLAVPTEKSGLTTTKLVMTVPAGFGIDSFAPSPPGWHMTQKSTGSGDNAVITQVTWTGGHTPTGEDSLFQFLAQPDSAKTYTFNVEQTYSDGSIVNWAGPESASDPSPAIKVVSSVGGGGGTSTLSVIALIVGALGLVAGGFALAGGRGGLGSDEGSGRPLA
jgi:uncharacterized protein YcnI